MLQTSSNIPNIRSEVARVTESYPLKPRNGLQGVRFRATSERIPEWQSGENGLQTAPHCLFTHLQPVCADLRAMATRIQSGLCSGINGNIQAGGAGCFLAEWYWTASLGEGACGYVCVLLSLRWKHSYSRQSKCLTRDAHVFFPQWERPKAAIITDDGASVILAMLPHHCLQHLTSSHLAPKQPGFFCWHAEL